MLFRRTKPPSKEARLPNQRVLLLAAVGLLVIIGLSTALGISMTLERVRHSAQLQIESIADQSIFAIQRRYDGAIFALNAMRGLFDASGSVNNDEFVRFMESSGFKEEFPKFGAVGYIPNVPHAEKEAFVELMRKPVAAGGLGVADFTITPFGDREEYWPTTFVYPESAAGALLGYDQHSEPVRARNMERARDTGKPTVSDEVFLRSSQKRGAIVVAPIYRTKDTPATVEERRAAFLGVVAVSFYYEDYPVAAIPPGLLEKAGVELFMMSADGSREQFVASSEAPAVFDPYGSVSAARVLPIDTAEPIAAVFEARVSNLVTQGETRDLVGLVVAQILLLVMLVAVSLLAKRVFGYTALRRRTEIIASISHQLRTPLSKLRWSMEVLAEPGTTETKEVTETMKSDVAALNGIIADLLLFLEWGQMSHLGKNEPLVAISSIINDAVAKLPTGSAKGRVTVIADGTGKIEVRARREPLANALYQIIDNALTYGPAGSSVTVEAVHVGGAVVDILVRDRGYGIPKAEQGKIWDVFFRASNASLAKNQGSGIGLPLVRVIVEAHGGSVGFSSEEGAGTVFMVRLPLRRSVLAWLLPKLPNEPKG